MTQPLFTVADRDGFRIVSFEIPGHICTPEEFAAAVQQLQPRLPGSSPILLNGQGPVWGYGMLVHAAHPTPAIATFDPRLGYVVVASHDGRYVVGQVIPDPQGASATSAVGS